MSNDEALKSYNVQNFRTPDGYTSDIAVFTILSSKVGEFKPPSMKLMLMLIKRAELNAEGHQNFDAGKWALPGGFVHDNETALEAARRELYEETGVRNIHIEHFGVYDTPKRDPRGWIISNAHYAIVPEHKLAERKANDDAQDVKLISVDDVFQLDLAFDHYQIITDAICTIKNDLLQTNIAKNFLQEFFTYSELQAVLKTVTNDPAILSDQAFSRKIKSLPFIKEVTGKKTQRTSKTPTQLYQFVDEINSRRSIYTARY
ncbi:NUDIX domain-containing protein [Bacillus weihaiensis]|uniref:NUDIX domain-containing protein n=1 Tax=Bacillus weihaiensis TaxID=1547283 RepID=UPI00235458D6|nr:NUDIX domain-containing protein [Bacillus weihaiensis]